MQKFDGTTTILVSATPVDLDGRKYGAVVGSLKEAVKVCVDLRRRGNFQPLTVLIAAGEYFLDRELTLTPELFSVCFETLSGKADVIISGAEKRAAEKAEFCGKNCLSISVPKGITDLYTGSRRVYPTRFPEKGYLEFAGAENEGIMLDDVSKWVKL